LGFELTVQTALKSEEYFAGSGGERRKQFLQAFEEPGVDGVVGLRGGYGSNYLLDRRLKGQLGAAKCMIGYSDLTSLQIFLWQRLGWITFYGPMVAAGFDAGAGKPNGYDENSFWSAVSRTAGGWKFSLEGESLVGGESEGRLLGGCLTLVQTTLGTPWELDTRGAILVLEDRAMKPWQVDRALMHLKPAGKLAGVRGIVLGEFPECEPPVAGSPTVRDVCKRIFGPLGVPIVFGAPVGHTPRPMLTLPLGVKVRLSSQGGGVLEILEPAVVP
jgi:muramoyltetrapeptide carboxypeptidase